MAVSVTLTSVTPANPAVGDMITLNGTGFDAINSNGGQFLDFNNALVNQPWPAGGVFVAKAASPSEGYAFYPDGPTGRGQPIVGGNPGGSSFQHVSDTQIKIDTTYIPAGAYRVAIWYCGGGPGFEWYSDELSPHNAPPHDEQRTAFIDITLGTTGSGGAGGGGTNPTVIPTVTAVSPASGTVLGGNTVAISGTGFTGATAAWFGEGVVFSFASPPAMVVESDSRITVLSVPSSFNSGTVDVKVSNSGGDSPLTSADIYTYLPQPTITSLSLAYGPTAGGQTVSLNGSGFTGATQVMFGSVPATGISVISDQFMTCTAPPQEESGVVNVFVSSPTGVSTAASGNEYEYGITISGIDLYRIPVSSAYGASQGNENSGGFGTAERIAAGLPLTGATEFVDYTAASGVTYLYYAVATNNAVSFSSNPIESGITFDALWVHAVDSPGVNRQAFLYTPGEKSEDYSRDAVFMDFVGRSRPVVEFGTATVRKVKIDLKMLTSDNRNEYNFLRLMAQTHRTLCYRDSRGRVLFGVLTGLPEQDELMAYRMTIELQEVDYKLIP